MLQYLKHKISCRPDDGQKVNATKTYGRQYCKTKARYIHIYKTNIILYRSQNVFPIVIWNSLNVRFHDVKIHVLYSVPN